MTSVPKITLVHPARGAGAHPTSVPKITPVPAAILIEAPPHKLAADLAALPDTDRAAVATARLNEVAGEGPPARNNNAMYRVLLAAGASPATFLRSYVTSPYVCLDVLLSALGLPRTQALLLARHAGAGGPDPPPPTVAAALAAGPLALLRGALGGAAEVTLGLEALPALLRLSPGAPHSLGPLLDALVARLGATPYEARARHVAAVIESRITDTVLFGHIPFVRVAMGTSPDALLSRLRAAPGPGVVAAITAGLTSDPLPPLALVSIAKLFQLFAGAPPSVLVSPSFGDRLTVALLGAEAGAREERHLAYLDAAIGYLSASSDVPFAAGLAARAAASPTTSLLLGALGTHGPDAACGRAALLVAELNSRAGSPALLLAAIKALTPVSVRRGAVCSVCTYAQSHLVCGAVRSGDASVRDALLLCPRLMLAIVARLRIEPDRTTVDAITTLMGPGTGAVALRNAGLGGVVTGLASHPDLPPELGTRLQSFVAAMCV